MYTAQNDQHTNVLTMYSSYIHSHINIPYAHTHLYYSCTETKCTASAYIQIAVTGVLSISFSTDQSSRFPWLSGVSGETISHLEALAKKAYDYTKKDQLIFHDLGADFPLKTLGRAS